MILFFRLDIATIQVVVPPRNHSWNPVISVIQSKEEQLFQFQYFPNITLMSSPAVLFAGYVLTIDT